MKLGIVGFGKIAARHLEVFRALEVDVVAAANRSEDGRVKAKEAGLATYASADELLAQESVDAVLVTTSLTENFEAAKALIPRGIPMLLEKPPGTSIPEVEELATLAETHGTPVLVGFNRLHYSILGRALEHAGGLEAVTSVLVEWSENPPHLARRGFSERQIARRNFSNSVHGLSLLAYLAGRISNPVAIASRRSPPFGLSMSLQGISERGTVATFVSSWDSQVPWRLRFVAAGHVYSFAPLEACEVVSPSRERTRLEPASYDDTYKPGFFGQAKVFLDVVRSRRVPAAHDLRAAVNVVELAHALTDACDRA
ncbi:MAG: Gfo/Idh/MocA family oxidoreductase [Myxococcota bacterium]